MLLFLSGFYEVESALDFLFFKDFASSYQQQDISDYLTSFEFLKRKWHKRCNISIPNHK